MAKKTEDGIEYSGGDYLVIEKADEPSTWHLRVKNADGKYDKQLAGAAHAALTVGYRGNKYDGPDKDKALTKLKSIYKEQGWDWPDRSELGAAGHGSDRVIVCFSSGELPAAEADTEGDDFALVERTGKFFEIGTEFKDVQGIQFSLSEQEADKIIAEFEPVEINHAHSKSRVDGPLDGMFGKVAKLWRDGKDIMAKYQIPRWLNRITQGKPLPMSGEFDLATKKPIGA